MGEIGKVRRSSVPDVALEPVPGALEGLDASVRREEHSMAVDFDEVIAELLLRGFVPPASSRGISTGKAARNVGQDDALPR